ncbi:centrosomal protein of 131 kDa isoform X2 [Thrips palmi]|nr:centrosomal protein of 131 kDa isoform X2 [Thrips palmi]
MRSLSQNDRDLPKCGKLSKEGEGSDLSLSGSQVSLVSRSRSVVGKASFRALSVSGPRVRRPMSAVPALSFTEITRDKRRPYSADSQMLLSSCQQKRNKLSARFSMSIDPIGLSHHDTETDGDIEFSSSTLVSSQLSDQLGGAWMELERRGLYLGQSSAPPPSSTDNGSDLLCYSDASDERPRSEKSLGERIQAMARDHVQQDRPSCAPKSVHEEISDGIQLEKYMNGDDPRKLSTKELHLRMVESGLISVSPQQSAAYEPKSNDSSRFKSEYSCHADTNPDPSQQKTELQGRIGMGRPLHPDILISEPGPSEFWNEHQDFFQEGMNSTCIDQISFPKEHDVDSFEGDSSCSNSGVNSQRRGRDVTTSSLFLGHTSHENDNPISWRKEDLAPVRFQQWVTDAQKSSGNVSNSATVTSPFFCNVRSSHPLGDKKSVDLDCTVEEVYTDSEYSKMYDSSRFKEKPVKCPSETESNATKTASNFESHIVLKGDSETLCSTTTNVMKSEQDSKFRSDSDASNICDHSAILEPTKLAAGHTDGTMNLRVATKPLTNIDSGEKCGKTTSSIFKEEQSIDKKPTKSNSFSEKKIHSPKNDSKKEQNHQVTLGSKRKNETKINSVGRRCGKGPLSHRSLSQPKEEVLPGESQPELLSWMAMCSDELEDSTRPCSNLQNEICEGEKDVESPYNEIMTILRVLEEKEDESSLMKILNKRSELKTPSETPSLLGTLISTAESDNASSAVNQREFEYSRSSPCVDGINAGVHSELKLTTKVDPSSKPQNSAACVGEVSQKQQPSVQGELRDLLTFLDAVDQSCSSVLQPKITPSPRASPSPPSASEDPHNLEELLMMGRSELAQEIVSLRLALEDRDATINLLRTALREQKDSQARQNAAHKSELENQMRQVKAECEAVIKRHQKFIDQLIADKASLSKRCESLVLEAKETEEKHVKALSNVEDKHKVEMQRIKDITAATEKLKRERWVENKTQKIKELTVRGLEPELTRLNSQHEQEMSALRTLHAQELEQMEVRAARRAAQQMEVLREQLVQEKEEALARERDMLRQRMEKQQLLFEEEGAEQRRRLVAEVRREQDRLATLESRLEVQFEERKRALEREVEQERERIRRDYADKLNEMHRKQQNEMLQFRESLKAEKEAWAETYQQQQKQTLSQTTNEIRDQLKRERDREIEVVIERLESEATISREEREKAAENRLRRVREQLTAELRDVELSLNTLKEKHAELRAQLQDREDKLVSSEALNRSLHTQCVETRKIADQLSAERADLKQVLQAELSSDMEALRQQLSEQHSRHQQQLQILAEQSERERQTHQQELQQLFDRVKLAIAKKEDVVKVAKARQRAAEDQISHLQALLEHRRKESLLS